MAQSFPSLEIGPLSHSLEAAVISIGRADDNLLVLDDASVSGHHAEIEQTEKGLVLRDLGSTNGTKVNDLPVTEAVLNDGDAICFGSVPARIAASPTTLMGIKKTMDHVPSHLTVPDRPPYKRKVTAAAVAVVLVAVTTAWWAFTGRPNQTSSHSSQPDGPQTTGAEPHILLEDFFRAHDRANLQDSGKVGGLEPGMTKDSALKALNSKEIPSDSVLFQGTRGERIKSMKFSDKLDSGDELESIVVLTPSDFPREIEFMALGFWNNGLFSVTYQYGSKTVSKNTARPDGYEEETEKIWKDFKSPVISAVREKYAPLAIAFPNVFTRSWEKCETLQPQWNLGDQVVYHGASKNVLAHVSEIILDNSYSGGELLFGKNQTPKRLETRYAIEARFFFIDYARQHGFNFLKKKDMHKLAVKRREGQRQTELDGERKAAAAAKEEKERQRIGEMKKTF